MMKTQHRSSEQLLPDLAAQGGSFPGETSRGLEVTARAEGLAQ